MKRSGDRGSGIGGRGSGVGGRGSGIALRSTIVVAGIVAVALAIATQRGEAHKAVTSKYTYNDDVFPIVREKCAQCHVEHGVAPMSLTTYKDAYPWAESIRAELIAGHMPPWTADESFGAVKRPGTLTAHELDVMLTWATGGNPQGDLNQTLPQIALKNEWTLGAPDLTLPAPAFTLPADKGDVTQEFTIKTGTTEPRWVRAVDLLPGTPSVVRSATIYLKGAPAASASAAPAPDQILALWLPGGDVEPLEGQLAFRLPPGAELGVRIHYKKTWQFEGQAISDDHSTIGLYFAREPQAREMLALTLDSPAPPPMDAMNHAFTFKRAIDEDVEALALRPDDLPPNIVVQMEAVTPDGGRIPMIRWNTRADWARRYWFAKPVTLPRGTTVEVVADFDNPDILSEAFDTLAPTKTPAPPKPLRMSLDVVPAHPKPTAP